MKSVAIDDPFFQGEALLLVEDPLTATVLGGCWRVRDSSALKIVARAVGGRERLGSRRCACANNSRRFASPKHHTPRRPMRSRRSRFPTYTITPRPPTLPVASPSLR